MTDVTAIQFQEDVNDLAGWSNGDASHTQTFRLGGTADSPAKVISDIRASADQQRSNILEQSVYRVVGDFGAGFTFREINQAGTYDNAGTEETYIFTGGESALPHVVPANTNPTTDSNYQRVTFQVTRNNVINSDFNASQKEFIACIPRIVAGAPELLNDATHEPLGFSGAQINGDYDFQINYTRDYGQVNSLIITPDNELAPYGIFCGGSVGTDNAMFRVYAQLVGTLSTTSFGSTTLFKSPTDVSVSTTNDVITVTHTAAAVAGESVSVTPNFPGPRVAVDVTGVNTFTVTAMTDFAGLIGWNGTAFGFVSGVPSPISDSQTGISFSNSGGDLVITHPSESTYDVQVTAFGSTYTPFIRTLGLTTTTIGFKDNSGNEVTTPTSNSQVFVRRKMNLKAKMPNAATFEVRGPIVAVRPSVLSDVTGSNFWALGTMQEPQP